MPKFLGEVFADSNKCNTREEAVAFLRTNKSPSLLMLFEAAFHPNVKWAIPDGPPPFKPDPSPYGNNPSTLFREAHRLYLFLECKKKIVHPVKREGAFISLLESLNKEEAFIMLAIKEHNLEKKYRWMTYQNVREAFPGLLPAEVKPSPLVESAIGSEEPSPKRGRGRPRGTKNSTKTSGGLEAV